jgi:hypothetical protein
VPGGAIDECLAHWSFRLGDQGFGFEPLEEVYDGTVSHGPDLPDAFTNITHGRFPQPLQADQHIKFSRRNIFVAHAQPFLIVALVNLMADI